MTPFDRDRALGERRHATRRLTRKYAVRDWWTDQARPLRSSDRPQPVDRWERDMTAVLLAISVLLAIGALAILQAKGYLA